MNEQAFDYTDSDESGFIQYDISGEAYKQLMNTCFTYCDSISFFKRSAHVVIPTELLMFQSSLSDEVKEQYLMYKHQNICVYNIILTPESQKIILTLANSIFSWIDGWGFHNVEDPVFYRNDKSIFLRANVHNGICTLFPRENEDVSMILKNPHWKKRNTMVSCR